MADEEGQNCATSNMSAVVWTTALCTMLLVLVVIAIYFLYCKRREHDWSSLWWKNNPGKHTRTLLYKFPNIIVKKTNIILK